MVSSSGYQSPHHVSDKKSWCSLVGCIPQRVVELGRAVDHPGGVNGVIGLCILCFTEQAAWKPANITRTQVGCKHCNSFCCRTSSLPLFSWLFPLASDIARRWQTNPVAKYCDIVEWQTIFTRNKLPGYSPLALPSSAHILWGKRPPPCSGNFKSRGSIGLFVARYVKFELWLPDCTQKTQDSSSQVNPALYGHCTQLCKQASLLSPEHWD